jgi:hypothetical protein
LGVLGATPLGVLYESSATNNLVSPTTLTIPNTRVTTNLVLDVASIVANRALRVMEDKRVTTSSMTSTQQDWLGTIVGGVNRLILGGSEIVSGEGSPTNGTAYVQRILYINSLGTNLNDTFWGNWGTNWYAIASTNGGSIIESQINFSDNTTGNASTNMHGFELKLAGDPLKFKRSDGVWAAPNNILSNTITGTRYMGFFDSSAGAYTYYKTNFATINGTSLILPNINLLAGGEILGDATTDMLIGDVSAWNTMGINGVAASSLLRLDGLNKIRAVSIGTGLNWDGTTLSSTGGGTNSVSISGVPVSGQVTYWATPTAISGNNNFVFDGSKLTVTHYGVPTGDTTGQLTSGTYTPTRTPYAASCTTVGTSDFPQHYTRIGNEVTVSGRLQMARTGSARLEFSVSLPITPATPLVPNDGILAGTGNVYDLSISLPIGSVAIYDSGNFAFFRSVGSSTTGTVREFWYTFTYTTN